MLYDFHESVILYTFGTLLGMVLVQSHAFCRLTELGQGINHHI